LDATYHFPCEKERWKKDESRGWAKCFWLDMRTHARTSEHAAPLYVAKGRHQRAAQSMQQAVGNTVATATHGSYTGYRLMTLTRMTTYPKKKHACLSGYPLYSYIKIQKEKEKRKHGSISSRQSSCLSVELASAAAASSVPVVASRSFVFQPVRLSVSALIIQPFSSVFLS
jgi:hypothetical protein